MSPTLEVWGVAYGDDVRSIMLLCPEHSAWPSDPEFALPLGLHAFRVKARAWRRRVLRSAEKHGSGCVECAVRAGRGLVATEVGPIGIVKASELDVSGGDA